MEGRKELIKAIQNEFKVGLSRLPAYGFSIMFRKKESVLITESMDSMRTWLSVIKQGRIVHQDPKRLCDDFDKKGALRTSLELQEYTDAALDELD